LKGAIVTQLDTLAGRDKQVLLDQRYARYRRMGEFTTVTPSAGGKAERASLADRLRAMFESGRAVIVGDPLPLKPYTGDEEEEPPLREEI
jgi:hypothetical protein